MIKRGFLRRKTKTDPKSGHIKSVASNTMLFLGVIILITSLIYMLVNLDRAESVIGVWVIFMMIGLFLVVMSHMIKWLFKR